MEKQPDKGLTMFYADEPVSRESLTDPLGVSAFFL